MALAEEGEVSFSRPPKPGPGIPAGTPIGAFASAHGDEMNRPESVLPHHVVTVVIRDDSPMMNTQSPPRRRSVRIELTDEQLEVLALEWVGRSGGADIYEEIESMWIEPDDGEGCVR